MKPSIILISLISGLVAVSANDLSGKLSIIDSDFQKTGASLEILNDYDSLLRQINLDTSTAELEKNSMLSKIYYKKALIELSLGKELQSIENFAKSLELNSNNPVVKKNLLDLCVKFGLKDRLHSFKQLFSTDDIQYAESLETLNSVDELANDDDLEKLNQAINISPGDSNLRLKRIELTTKEIQNTGDSSSFPDLVDDMTNMIKINPIQNLQFINKLSEIYLFALSEFPNALNYNKKCLHFDMDDALCKKNSKFLNKYSPILNNLSEFNKFFEFVQEKGKTDDDFNLNDEDIKSEAKRLQDPSQFLKIRRENENFKTNQDYLLQKAQEFNTQYKLKSNALQLTILRTLVFDAFIRNDKKSLKALSKRLNTVHPNSSESFFPLILANVDIAIAKKDYNHAIQLMKSITENGKKTTHYKQRESKIQQFQQQQQRQQQQRQQQQQQQQRQQYFQQQQKPKTPKNDYYKILDVPRDADSTTIRKAYREKTKQYHPDKYKGNLSNEEIETKMTQINHAYEVLSDPDLRKNYDQGEDPNDPESMHQGAGQRANPFQGQQYNPFGRGFNFQFGGPGFKFTDNRHKKRNRA